MKAKKRKATQVWTEAQRKNIHRLCSKALAQMDEIDKSIAKVEKKLDTIDEEIDQAIDETIKDMNWFPDDEPPQEPEPVEPSGSGESEVL